MSRYIPVLFALLLSLATACGGGVVGGGDDGATFTVERGNLKIVLTESGTLEARNKVSIRPKIKTRATILSIIEEGQVVKAGDVLVELDKDSVEKEIEKLEDQLIQLAADLKNARTDLEIQQGENESDREKAKLRLLVAREELERYVEGDHGQQLRDRKLKIDQAESRLKRATDEYSKMPKLLEEGFVTPNEVEEQKEIFELAEAALETALQELELYEKYTHPMALRQKQADVSEAEREQKRVLARAEAREEGKQAVVRQRERQHETAVAKLEELKSEFENLTITAPQDGIVIYGGSRDRWGNAEDEVKVGATAFPGKSLIELPDLSLMDVKLQIHQADISKLKKGQGAWITEGGSTKRKFKGEVAEIASIAKSSNWRDPVRRFEVVIQLTDKLEGQDLRAGIRVEVEIDVGEIEDVLFVPVQTVSSTGAGYYVYVADGGEVKRRRVSLGVANEQYVQVRDGLAEGDEVLLVNPEVVSEDDEEEAAEGKAPNGRPSGAGGRKPGGGSGRPSGGGGRSGGR